VVQEEDAINPATVIKRFPELRFIVLKGKPHFGYICPWIEAMAIVVCVDGGEDEDLHPLLLFPFFSFFFFFLIII